MEGFAASHPTDICARVLEDLAGRTANEGCGLAHQSLVSTGFVSRTRPKRMDTDVNVTFGG